MFIRGDGIDIKYGLTAFREPKFEANYIRRYSTRMLMGYSKFNIV